MSVYLLYRTVDLYDRAMNLNIDFQMYRKEFESLQIELQQVIHLIHEELLPNWRHLSTGVLRKITLDVDEKLSRYHAELMQLLQHIDAQERASWYCMGFCFSVGIRCFVRSVSFGWKCTRSYICIRRQFHRPCWRSFFRINSPTAGITPERCGGYVN